MRIAPQAFAYLGIVLGSGLILACYAPTRLAALGPFALAVLIAFFFRDPERTPPVDPRLWVSPADGRVVYIGKDSGGGSGRDQVSIFLSLFDVHINRSPLSAVISDVVYRPGRFLPAYRTEASLANEQNQIELRAGPIQVTVRQVAGVIARRIVFFKKKSDRVERGERLGLIQFGSRVDVLLPPGAKLRVSLGDRLKGGESVLAEAPADRTENSAEGARSPADRSEDSPERECSANRVSRGARASGGGAPRALREALSGGAARRRRAPAARVGPSCAKQSRAEVASGVGPRPQ